MVRRYEMKPSWECGVMVDTLREDVDGRYVLASDYDAMRALLAEAERDAARYRYWRKHHGWTGYFDDGYSNEDDPASIDAAIDAAMAAETVGEVQK